MSNCVHEFPDSIPLGKADFACVKCGAAKASNPMKTKPNTKPAKKAAKSKERDHGAS